MQACWHLCCFQGAGQIHERDDATRGHSTSIYYNGSSSRTRCQISTLRESAAPIRDRSEEHTSELQSQSNLVCRLLLEKKKQNNTEGAGNSPSHLAQAA